MWNFLIKYTYPLFESICVLDGKIQNAVYHQKRFEQSYYKLYDRLPKYRLIESVSIPPKYSTGKVKLRISYNKRGKKIKFFNYVERPINSLKLVVDNHIDYSLKYEKRQRLEQLYLKKGNCDDILIIKNDSLSDSSYSNIAFYDGNNWVTPDSPLLKGTMREKLLKLGTLKESAIGPADLKNFEAFQLINAMIGFDPRQKIPIQKIMA